MPLHDHDGRAVTPPLIGAVEAGGTNINLAIGTSPADLRARTSFPTGAPEVTIERILGFFEEAGPVDAFGIASFGPVRVDRAAPDWGHILATPKPGWSGASIANPLIERFARPVALDTDVNVAALGEHRHGAGRGKRVLAYLTVGTGIGLGLVVDGRALHGLLHPEFGHVRVVRMPGDDRPGACPFHGDCLEGLASGAALARRWGTSLGEPGEHPALTQVADYLGQACATLVLTVSAERILIGGGVLRTPGLLQRIRPRMEHWLGGYIAEPALGRPDFITAPGLGADAALVGAIALGHDLVNASAATP